MKRPIVVTGVAVCATAWASPAHAITRTSNTWESTLDEVPASCAFPVFNSQPFWDAFAAAEEGLSELEVQRARMLGGNVLTMEAISAVTLPDKGREFSRSELTWLRQGVRERRKRNMGRVRRVFGLQIPMLAVYDRERDQRQQNQAISIQHLSATKRMVIKSNP